MEGSTARPCSCVVGAAAWLCCAAANGGRKQASEAVDGFRRALKENGVIRVPVVVIGAGPYGLSLAAHLDARGIAFRIFGRPMAFWASIAAASPDRFLKSFCFGTT